MVIFACILAGIGAGSTLGAAIYMIVDSCILGHYHNTAM